jgi:hypothetical protein
MIEQAIQCAKCKRNLPPAFYNRGGQEACPGCGSATAVEVFPAFFREAAQGTIGEAVLVEGEAGCFFHPQKKAVVHCDGCGRFLCGLCDCELHGKHFCPGCLETGRKKGKIQNLENQRTLYGGVALSLAVLPLLAWPVTLVTAPIAVYIALRYWNAPRSIVSSGRWPQVVAIVVAVLELVGWAALFISIRSS